MKSRGFILPLVALLAIATWYVFARFTVDDAFITWRYGKNLVDFGIWNYNPSSKDMTQAYTNPIYALLSIVPNVAGWDVVLFFKIVSSALLLGFLVWAKRKCTGSWVLVLLFVAMPATIVHVYGGLETFLFVWLMAALLVALYENNRTQAILVTLGLFATRPEAWLLFALVPLYYLVDELPASGAAGRRLPRFRLTLGRGIGVALALGIPLAIYFGYHRMHFGHALPNTFYVKSGAHLDLLNLVKFSIFLLPLSILFLLDRWKLGLMALAMFGAMVLSYSTSLLYMDYAGRFAFHLFAPIYLFTVYLLSRSDAWAGAGKPKTLSASRPIELRRLAGIGAAIVFCFFAVVGHTNTLGLAMYYPRALHAHADLGKTLGRISGPEKLRAFSIGDAGMAAYYSRIDALDNIGLGSSAIAANGITPSLLDLYGIDLLVFYSWDDGIKLSEFRQQALFDWGKANGFSELCDVYWLSNYKLRVYSRKPIPAISGVCASSKLYNDKPNKSMIRETLLSPPWQYWHE